MISFAFPDAADTDNVQIENSAGYEISKSREGSELVSRAKKHFEICFRFWENVTILLIETCRKKKRSERSNSLKFFNYAIPSKFFPLRCNIYIKEIYHDQRSIRIRHERRISSTFQSSIGQKRRKKSLRVSNFHFSHRVFVPDFRGRSMHRHEKFLEHVDAPSPWLDCIHGPSVFRGVYRSGGGGGSHSRAL